MRLHFARPFVTDTNPAIFGRGRITTAMMVVLATISPVANAVPPSWDKWDTKINALIREMSLEEKLGQLTLQWGGQSEDGNPDVRRHSEDDLAGQASAGVCGAFLGAHGADYTNRLQRAAVERSKHRIPLLIGNDVIHGYHTIFPIPIAEACSWNPELIEAAAHVAATEARASGTNWTFAPMVDVTRDPRWGRIVEGAGEDPFLGSQIAAARVKGFQGNNLAAKDSVIACAKHFVAYGAPEGGRDYNTADISSQTLYEVHLPAFKAAVDAGSGSIMSAFNEVNGVPATGNAMTLTDILRHQWKFGGFVVSDWSSVTEMVNHGYAVDSADAAVKAINAGVDMDMSSGSYRAFLADAVKAGRVSTSTIDLAVKRVLRLKFALGLFENPYSDKNRESVLLCKEHRETARNMARQSIVLLRNEGGLLPVRDNVTSIALIGPMADDHRDSLGTWAVIGKPADVVPKLEKSIVSLLEGVRERAGNKIKVRHARGCDLDSEDRSGFDEAITTAKNCDLVIIAVGESREMSGEAACRTSLELPGVQQQLVEAVQNTGKPVVVVVQSGRPLSISWIAAHVPAVLQSWHLGTEAGHAMADVLFGDVDPSGRLPVSIPRNVGQVPIFYNHKNSGRPASPEKYTSKYLDAPWTPLFPFGFGLSYTTFSYENVEIVKSSLTANDSLEVSATVTNSGARPGVEIVQLYVRDLVGSMTRPVKELKAFSRIELKSGESRIVRFSVPVKSLGFYDHDMNYIVEPGSFKLWIGPNSDSGVESSFEVVAAK